MTDNAECIPTPRRHDWRDMLLEDFAHDVAALEDALVSARQDADAYRVMALAALDAVQSLTEKLETQKVRTAALLDELRDIRGYPGQAAA